MTKLRKGIFIPILCKMRETIRMIKINRIIAIKRIKDVMFGIKTK